MVLFGEAVCRAWDIGEKRPNAPRWAQVYPHRPKARKRALRHTEAKADGIRTGRALDGLSRAGGDEALRFRLVLVAGAPARTPAARESNHPRSLWTPGERLRMLSARRRAELAAVVGVAMASLVFRSLRLDGGQHDGLLVLPKDTRVTYAVQV